jgi:predicted nicotinamide N-methyase
MLRSFTICNVQLTIKLSPDLGNGGLVWPSTFVLAQYLNSSRTLSGKCIAELGAGTGLLGIWAATQGAHVVLTDVAELVPLLQENARMNMDQISKGGGSIRVEPVLWGETSHVPASVFDCALIVGSDLVHWIAFTLFDDDSRLLLCQTMRRLLGARCDKTVYLCHEVRTKLREAQFLLMVNEAGLLVHEELSTTYARVWMPEAACALVVQARSKVPVRWQPAMSLTCAVIACASPRSLLRSLIAKIEILLSGASQLRESVEYAVAFMSMLLLL